MPLSSYTRSILSTRALPLKRIRAVDERLETALQAAWAVLDTEIAGMRGAEDKLRYDLVRARQDTIQRTINELAIGLKRELTSQAQGVAEEVSLVREESTNALLAESGSRMLVDFSAVPQATLEQLARRIDTEGLKVSANIWARNQMTAIEQVLLENVAAGRSAVETSMRLREFVLGADEFSPEELRDLRTVKGADRRRFGTSIKAKAKRLARSEIVNAAWEAGRLSADASPIVGGVRWNLSANHPKWDVCDILAGQDLYGLGSGVYPAESIPPKPHPNDMCYQTDEIRPVGDWESPKPASRLQENPADVSVVGIGTERFQERQHQLFRDLVGAR